MHRQRKRDLNLKPNRVLDKRSSRGMIYENEELRLRTLAIADDVDRGQSDIRKLRKENDQLKRDIWSLRDECEKLEEILKKVVIQGNLDPAELPYPELFMDEGFLGDISLYEGLSRRGSGSFDGVQTMFETEGDTGSVIEQAIAVPTTTTDQNVPEEMQMTRGESSEHMMMSGQEEMSESDPGPSTSASTSGLQKIPTVLETLAEVEGENNRSPTSADADVEFHLPDPNLVDLDNNNQFHVGTPPGSTPVIEITPASICSSPIVESEEQISKSQSPLSEEIEDKGEEFETASSCSKSPSTSTTNTTTEPSPTPDREGNDNEIVSDYKDNDSPVQDGGCVALIPQTFHVTQEIQIDPKSLTSSATPPFPFPPPIKKKLSTLKLVKSSTVENNNRRSLHFTSSSPLQPKLCPSCYQSEPILPTSSERVDYHVMMNGRIHSPAFYPLQAKSWWIQTQLERHLVVGHVEDGPVLKSQEIVDELEAQWDPTLEKVRGIRILGQRIFLSLRDEESVTSLLTSFQAGLWVNSKQPSSSKYLILFSTGAEGYAELHLSGLGPEVPDTEVISVLNQYGQVVDQVERRSYKGVEVWERGAKIHLVKAIRPHLIIGGYDVSVRMMKGGDGGEECQGQASVSLKDALSDSHVVDESHSHAANAVKPHKQVGRCNSSIPRLGAGAGTSPVLPARKTSASICAESVKPEEHPSRLFQKNPNLNKTSAVIGKTTVTQNGNNVSTPNLNCPVKKPLTRLMKSSPVPPNPPEPTTEANNNNPINKEVTPPQPQAQQQQQQNPGGPPSPAVGFRAAFYRNLSAMDPRRASNASGGENGPQPQWAARRASNAYYQRFGGHQPVSQMNSNSSSHNSTNPYDNPNRKGGPVEKLPWCGCWGNGCV